MKYHEQPMRTKIDKRKLPEARENASDKITFGLSFIGVSLIVYPVRKPFWKLTVFLKTLV